LWGSLSVEPLANGDSGTYPPILGSEADATEDHYLESNYAATAISDSNDPYITLIDELEEHFGSNTGGGNTVVFINQAERPETEDLTSFVEVPDQYIRTGDDADIPQGLPAVPGRILGRHNHGCWVVEWRWMPASYMIALNMDAPKPLMKRVDPSDTGLARDLHIAAQDMQYPFESSQWRHRFGFGVGNRLNGVVMELGTGGTYTIPSAYQ